jgi:HEAT repeat protein
VERIGELRGLAGTAAPAVLRCLQDRVKDVRAAAALTLAKIEAKDLQTVEGLTGLLDDPEPEVRANAGIALGTLGPIAAPALPTLHVLRQDKDARVVAIANAAVERIETK